MRVIAKSLVIGCVIELVVIELLYCSDALPPGLMISFPTCIIYALGFQLITIIAGILLMLLIEFPLTRIIQWTILPVITHDGLLSEKHFQVDDDFAPAGKSITVKVDVIDTSPETKKTAYFKGSGKIEDEGDAEKAMQVFGGKEENQEGNGEEQEVGVGDGKMEFIQSD